jgi:hypothetical protein
MGQQQFLLILLGVLIVGIAIAVGAGVFKANEIDSGRSALINDLQFFAGKARAFYEKPVSMGGGWRSYANITIGDITPNTENKNGRYYIESISSTEVAMVGVGRVINGSDTIRVRMRFQERKNITEIIN